jgi:hypothetical protein
LVSCFRDFVAKKVLRTMVRSTAFGLVLMLAIAGGAAAQNVETDPLQCWWRTSAGAVRVGDPFEVVLTCAVLETDTATVIVDQSRLEPSVVQFAPFEVLGGSHGADLRSDQRRFFQYVYRLRLIAENLFGRDVSLPETKLSYHVQSRMGDRQAALQGRDQTYLLPPQSVRVMSLVPADATDIRDTAGETFGDLDQRAFRANLFTIIGGVLFTLAALMALLALVRVARRYRKTATASQRLMTDQTVLRGVGRELARVRRERDGGSWTPELAGRALAALRIAGTYLLGRPVSLLPANKLTAEGEDVPEAGRLILKTGWPRGKRIAVSGAVTSQTIARELARGAANARQATLLESLGRALSTFTTAHFGREGTLDEGALDEALGTAKEALNRAKLEQFWIMKRLAARRAPTPMDARVWSR